jgi:hypothetical protein
MSDITLQDIYDLFKASQENLEASREEFDRRLAETDRRATKAKTEADRPLRLSAGVICHPSSWGLGGNCQRSGIQTQNLVTAMIY